MVQAGNLDNCEFTVSRQTGDLIVNATVTEFFDIFEPTGLGKWSGPVTLTTARTRITS